MNGNVTGDRLITRQSYVELKQNYERYSQMLKGHRPAKLALTELEETVLYKLSAGKSQTEIAESQKVTQAAVSKAFSRAKKKLVELKAWIMEDRLHSTTRCKEDLLYKTYAKRYRVRSLKKDNELMAELEELRNRYKGEQHEENTL